MMCCDVLLYGKVQYSTTLTLKVNIDRSLL